jgi:hypothetical protein
MSTEALNLVHFNIIFYLILQTQTLHEKYGLIIKEGQDNNDENKNNNNTMPK